MLRGANIKRGPMRRPPSTDVKLVGEWLWPNADTQCSTQVWERLPDLDQALALCRRFDVAVQAGGNCGVWPKRMAERFGAVYTFEPDPLNFRCLAHNVPNGNVFKFNAAVGNHRGGVDLYRTDNCGAHRVTRGGSIPVLRIDDLGLGACDFLQLDVEGYEYQALLGAQETLARHHPVVMYEVKGKARYYGDNGKVIPEMLAGLGYKLVLNLHADWVYVWEGA